ncbi:Non-reducing end beta-L-arabinofuranosidase [Pseudocercospora fuligena]|uniref:Non-reducing end beta-L-arabinofuranosidase n=1 Tax=Pseudocercospora fuligena TaxID=685502 RepID=A0A8H6R6G1_9PEZI|nr:Non-reducing end beta-L-arabinofuranosidase [Pseudocercospora fuligena]
MAYPQTAFAATSVHDNSLIGRRRTTVCASTLLYQLQVLKDTGRYDAFKLKWHPVYDEPTVVWPIPNHLFWDSDVAKWIEGACYLLKHKAIPEVDHAIQELVEMIRSAQQPDGYLNIHYTVVEPGKRFTNLRDMHEMYNCGHMIEAALAHSDFYRNDLLLAPMIRYVDLLCETFGPGASQLHGYPGHPEIELALLRLHDRTGDPKHLALARYFITERGNHKGVEDESYFLWEARKRGDDFSRRPAFYPKEAPKCLWYHQAHAPIIEQPTIEGHSVRAMYLLTAVADLIRIEPSSSQDLNTALYRLWNNMTDRKMYVTGGIGAIEQWEGFGQDFFLPQGTDEGGCYSETCASIGVMMLAQRLLQIDLDAKFADIMELCLYNTVLTSMSHDGKGFTYDNQLASSDESHSKRSEWFTVACCPPNILRLLGQIGGYAWSFDINQSQQSAVVAAHLYISSSLKFSIGGQEVHITQNGGWPWNGDIDFVVETGSVAVTLKLRIPQWATTIEMQPWCPDAVREKGYLTLPAEWIAQNRAFKLSIPLKPRWLAAHPFTNQNTVSLARGPVVYCVEDVDNQWVQDHFKGVFVNPQNSFEEHQIVDDKTGDEYVGITLQDGARNLPELAAAFAPMLDAEKLKASLEHAPPVSALHFIPYYFRSNRGGKGHMRVGLKHAS